MIILPRTTLKTASQGDNPRAMAAEASERAGSQIHIPTHRAVMLYVVQVL